MGKVHHFMTGDKMKGFVCHECGFTTDKVEEAANHNIRQHPNHGEFHNGLPMTR